MCKNRRYIFNKYIQRDVLVNCGHCAACIQSKAAARATRIRNNMLPGQIALFVTLTYKNEYVPYFNLSEVMPVMFPDGRVYRRSIPIHRDARPRLVKEHGKEYIVDVPCDLVDLNVAMDIKLKHLEHCKPLRHYHDRVGLLDFGDCQNFLKRLRINLQRNYPDEINKTFSYFACGEYGRKSHRPHFHLLIFIDRQSEATFRSAIAASWLYEDKSVRERNIEVARNAANYVSGYVNKRPDVPFLLTLPPFRQRHSYSQGFGCGLPAFSLRSLLEKLDRRALTYSIEKTIDGKSTLVDIPIPKYVINRYFPKFKGYSRSVPYSLRQFLQFPKRYREYFNEVELTDDEYRQFVVRQNNAYQYYHDVVCGTRQDYAIHFEQIWNLYESTKLKFFYDSHLWSDDWITEYDNCADLFPAGPGTLPSPAFSQSLCELYSHPFDTDPNNLPYINRLEHNLVSEYTRAEQYKYIVNEVHAALGRNV